MRNQCDVGSSFGQGSCDLPTHAKRRSSSSISTSSFILDHPGVTTLTTTEGIHYSLSEEAESPMYWNSAPTEDRVWADAPAARAAAATNFMEDILQKGEADAASELDI